MKCLTAVALLLGGCVGANQSTKELLTPDQFHVNYTRGCGNSWGYLGRTNDPWGYVSEGEFDAQAVTFGFSWNLTAPVYARSFERAAQALSARLAVSEASRHTVTRNPIELPTTGRTPTNVTIELSETTRALLEAWFLLLRSGPCTETEQEDDDQEGLFGIAPRVWTQLIVTLTVVLSGLGGVAVHRRRKKAAEEGEDGEPFVDSPSE